MLLPTGAGGPTVRGKALERFLTDPNCKVMLMMLSNSSGAAGLTLNVASCAYMLDPPLNPGLEAQAAARIHRSAACSFWSQMDPHVCMLS